MTITNYILITNFFSFSLSLQFPVPVLPNGQRAAEDGGNFMFMSILLICAVILYLFRPNSLRRSIQGGQDKAPRPPSDQNVSWPASEDCPYRIIKDMERINVVCADHFTISIWNGLPSDQTNSMKTIFNTEFLTLFSSEIFDSPLKISNWSRIWSLSLTIIVLIVSIWYRIVSKRA